MRASSSAQPTEEKKEEEEDIHTDIHTNERRCLVVQQYFFSFASHGIESCVKKVAYNAVHAWTFTWIPDFYTRNDQMLTNARHIQDTLLQDQNSLDTVLFFKGSFFQLFPMSKTFKSCSVLKMPDL